MTANATTTWNDILLRKDLSDQGSVPYTGGVWTNSPDIIPTGTNVTANPQATFGTVAAYGQDLGQATVPYQPNYFYVRGKNLSAGSDSGTLSLYYCPANLFLFPSLWTNNQMKTSSGKSTVDIGMEKPGDIGVTPEPFTFLPTSTEHHCLIARVSTKANPNPLPSDGDFPDMAGLAKFIVNHPDYAWRNVTLVDKAVPTFTNSFLIDTTTFKPDTNQQYLIGISFKNLTPGASLAFSAGTPIPSGPDQGKVIQLVQTSVSQVSGSLGTSYLTIPGGYKTWVSYSYWAETPIQANWSVTFYAIQIVNPGSELSKHALPLHDLGVPGLTSSHPLVQLADGMTQGIIVGNVRTVGA